MNFYKQHALQHIGLVKPEENYFIYHPNSSLTSSRTKQNRVQAHIFQKLILIRKHENIRDIIIALLKQLTGQFFYPNYQGNNELRNILLYYNLTILQNPEIYQLFYSNETPQKLKFQLWLKYLCHLDDQKLQIEVEKYQYDSEYINTHEYNLILAMIRESEIDIQSIDNGYILLKLINYKEDNEKLEILKKKKDCYMNDNYVLKKEWLSLMIKLDQPITLRELQLLTKVDIYDSDFQCLLISSFIKLDSTESAIQQIIDHLYVSEGNLDIWNFLYMLINDDIKKKYHEDFQFLIKLKFGQQFLRQMLQYPKTQDLKRFINNKILFLQHFDNMQSQKYYDFLQKQEKLE